MRANGFSATLCTLHKSKQHIGAREHFSYQRAPQNKANRLKAAGIFLLDMAYLEAYIYTGR